MDPARTLTLAPPSEEPAYRTAPHNTEAEQALLGAVLVNNATYHRVSEFLLTGPFLQLRRTSASTPPRSS